MTGGTSLLQAGQEVQKVASLGKTVCDKSEGKAIFAMNCPELDTVLFLNTSSTGIPKGHFFPSAPFFCCSIYTRPKGQSFRKAACLITFRCNRRHWASQTSRGSSQPPREVPTIPLRRVNTEAYATTWTPSHPNRGGQASYQKSRFIPQALVFPFSLSSSLQPLEFEPFKILCL